MLQVCCVLVFVLFFKVNSDNVLEHPVIFFGTAKDEVVLVTFYLIGELHTL